MREIQSVITPERWREAPKKLRHLSRRTDSIVRRYIISEFCVADWDGVRVGYAADVAQMDWYSTTAAVKTWYRSSLRQ